MEEAGTAYQVYHETRHGRMILGDSLDVMRTAYGEETVDLVVTSPPFALVRKKEYGNEDAGDFVEWFRPFGEAIHRLLKESGSLVIDIGGAWNAGVPTRSLYHFKLLIMLAEEVGFHLAQEFYWWNPSKLPTPAEWVNVRRVRVKDAVNTVWWLSKTPWPKASNRRVLQPYSQAMKTLLRTGYKAMRRPSGHDISGKFARNNRASIPPNLLAIPNTDSNGSYQRYCRERGIAPHPARYPGELPEFFVRMLTNAGDAVVDPFGGSCVTGEVCERLGRRWTCIELQEEYLAGAMARFQEPTLTEGGPAGGKRSGQESYQVYRPGLLWTAEDEEPLRPDGGRERG